MKKGMRPEVWDVNRLLQNKVWYEGKIQLLLNNRSVINAQLREMNKCLKSVMAAISKKAIKRK